jgi:hypothetical protein
VPRTALIAIAAVALVAVLAFVLLHNDSNTGDAPAPVPDRGPTTPLDARAFVDTIGVNVHLFYVDTAYGNYAMVKQRLTELGVRHVRDGFDPAHTPQFFDRVNDLAAAGIKSTLIACRIAPAGIPWTTYIADAKTKVRAALDAVEGVNEPDIFARDLDWPRLARGCQRDVYRDAKGRAGGAPLKVPVLGPSVQASDTRLGNISQIADGVAVHPYPGGRPPGSTDGYAFTRQATDARAHEFGDKPVAVVATETGYHDALASTGAHAAVSQRAAAIYLPRLFLEYAQAGISRTFAYELADERPDPANSDVELNYGLYESDWSPKRSAIALRNTIGLLDSPRRGPRHPLRVRLSNVADPDGAGPRGAVRDLLLQKADGSYWLALWQDSKVWDEQTRADISNPAVSVGVRLDRPRTMTSFRPTQGRSATARQSGRSVTVDVGDDVLLLRIT